MGEKKMQPESELLTRWMKTREITESHTVYTHTVSLVIM